MGDAFSEKVALVTGAGSGIGQTTAEELAAEGVKVVVSDIDAGQARQTAAQITAKGGEAVAFATDVSNADEVKALIDFAVATYGGLHLAFNNAGTVGKSAPIGELDLAEWHRIIDIDLHGVLYGMRYQIPAILESGGGSIVNTSSVMGLVAPLGQAAYTAAKHGIVGLTKAAALEYSRHGVRVNAIHPAYIATPGMLSFVPEDMLPELVKQHPIGRLGTADEVANLVVFLLSEKASFITGASYVIDGGYIAQ